MPARPPPISCLTQKLSLDKREGQAVSQSTRCFLEVTKRLSREEFSELTQGRIRRYAIEWLECGNGRRYWGPGKESALLFYPADKHRILGLLCDIITCQREHKKDRRYRKEVDRSPYDDDESDSDLSTDEQPRGERDQTYVSEHCQDSITHTNTRPTRNSTRLASERTDHDTTNVQRDIFVVEENPAKRFEEQIPESVESRNGNAPLREEVFYQPCLPSTTNDMRSLSNSTPTDGEDISKSRPRNSVTTPSSADVFQTDRLINRPRNHGIAARMETAGAETNIVFPRFRLPPNTVPVMLMPGVKFLLQKWIQLETTLEPTTITNTQNDQNSDLNAVLFQVISEMNKRTEAFVGLVEELTRAE